ncbi:p21-C-terminal region-binding protein-domain-containing protein [Flagelloscypha sp. PMI_526]|nr:p21-C-terminal region-binding protein-domain-containing protein [Flagelloscypha sp. PMI_526]
MPKRKQDNDDSDSEISLIDVDFDFFDPNPDVDYQALKRLIGQLFQQDAVVFDAHKLCDLILSQPFMGSTVKTDGEESDPYAFLTVINLHAHHENEAIKSLAQYLLQKSSADPAFHTALSNLLSQQDNHVGFVFCERLINMPVQVIPHMYRMLLEQITSVIEQDEAFRFSHLIFVSRTYHLTPEDESFLVSTSEARQPVSKKSKKHAAPPSSSSRPSDGIYSFHPEDESIKEAAAHTLDYKFTNANSESRNKESFGLDNRGRMMLVPWDQFGPLVQKMLQVYAP